MDNIRPLWLTPRTATLVSHALRRLQQDLSITRPQGWRDTVITCEALQRDLNTHTRRGPNTHTQRESTT